jgi:hypothetical protein
MIRNSGSPICAHRSVAADGRIVCDIIASGDSEVSANLCRDCPAKAIACEHLRFSLQKMASSPITVRYATGRVEVLDDHPPRIAFLRAACVEKVAPINSPRECVGCAQHSARGCLSAATAAVAPAPLVHQPPVPAAGAAAVCGGKVIQFPSRVPVRAEKMG